MFFGAGREVVSGIGVSLSAKPEFDSEDAIVDFFSLLLAQQSRLGGRPGGMCNP